MVTTFDQAIAGTLDRDDEDVVMDLDMTPAKGVPKLDPNKRARKEMMPDGVHWIEVRGGGSLQERTWAQRVAQKHDAMMADDAIGAYVWAMRRYGTYLAARVVDHNLVDKSGDALPHNCMELVYALAFQEVVALVNRVNNATAIFALPKAEKTSSGGIATVD